MWRAISDQQKQHIITFGIVFGILTLVIGSMLVLAKNARTNASPTPTPTSMLEIMQQNEASIAAAVASSPQSQQASSPSAAPAITGAREIEASQSASTASAARVRVTLTNGKTFVLMLYEDLAPMAVQNFLKKAASGYYNGNLFFRVEKDKEGKAAVLQTGDPTNSGQGGGQMPAEYNKRPFLAGSVGVARGQNRDINNDSQFFIVTQPVPSLDEEYTNFGDVIEGIEVVRSIKQGQPIQSVMVIR